MTTLQTQPASFEYRIDGGGGVEGWIDASAARAWAREASARFAASRAASSTQDAKREWRAGWVALNNATAALNLTDRAGAGIVSDGFPFGLARLDIQADPAALSKARASAVALAGSLEALPGWADGQPFGDSWFTAADGSRWGVRVYNDPSTGERAWALLPDPAAVLAFRRSMPPGIAEARAADIVVSPWGAYLARRAEIDATNARNAPDWGLTTPDEIRGFQVASDEVNRTLGAEWDAKQQAEVRRNADAILDKISTQAASTGIGAPLAAVFQAFKVFTGALPWVGVAAPPPALSRVRTGGVSPAATDRPRHTVPAAPAQAPELLGAATAIRGDAAVEYRGAAPGSTLRLPTPSGAEMADVIGGGRGSTITGDGERLEVGRQGMPGARVESESGTSPVVVVGAVVVAAGVLWWAMKGGR